MKSLLIGINAKYIHPSVGLYQLKANTTYPTILKEYTIKQDNLFIFEEIKTILNSKDITLVGFSSYLWNIEKIIFISSLIKQFFPTIKILVGGPEAGYDAKYFLTNYPQIDYIIQGEGEASFNELCMYLDNLIPIKNVSNLAYLDNNTYISNDIIMPDLKNIKLATLDIDDLENRIVYLESGRGCPYKCSYCTASLDNKVRFFPLEKVLEIVLILMEKKVKTVKFLDRTFNANMKYMLEILDLIDKYNICTTFQFEIVVEKITDEVIERINNLKTKFLRFEIGIQSTHEQVNEAVCRKQNMHILEEKLKKLQKTSKVDLHVDLIAGLPFETKEMFIESFNQVFDYGAKELQLGFLKFLRGTSLLNQKDEHGYIYDSYPPYEIISNNYMSKSDLDEIRLVEDMLGIYYNSSKLNNTFKYLLDNNIIKDSYQFFLSLSNDFIKGQLFDIFKHFDLFIKNNYNDYYSYVHFLLIEDYLMAHKTKPKIWWNYQIEKEERKVLYEYIVSNINLNIEDLYRYSIVYHDKTINKILIVIYKNFNPTVSTINT